MCQPSASNAIECDINPTTISTTIITAVTPITMRVRRSACEKSGTKSCALRKREWSVRCISKGSYSRLGNFYQKIKRVTVQRQPMRRSRTLCASQLLRRGWATGALLARTAASRVGQEISLVITGHELCLCQRLSFAKQRDHWPPAVSTPLECERAART